MNECGLVVQQARIRHGRTVLADIADIRADPGRPLTIVGESGSGKSILAHALMGILPPELEAVGSMSIGERRFDLADARNRRHLWGSSIALLPQEPALALNPTARVHSQVAEGILDHRPRGREATLRAEARLQEVGLAKSARAYPHTLSGGMAQRVAFAAATIGGAPILIVDEPSKGLDRQALDRLSELLSDHTAGGGVLITITHDLQLARRLGGDLMVMRDAEVVEAGPVDRVLRTPSHAYTRALLDAEPARWAFPWMRPTRQVAHPGKPVVTAQRISKSYGRHQVFEGISLQLLSGERWALRGPSGAGKTSLGNALLGIAPVDRGLVVQHQPRRGGVQKLYQDPATSFPARVTLERAMSDVAQRHRVTGQRVRELLEEVGLPLEILTRKPHQVSGGELQRVAIVRALIPRPHLVMADEATSRLDLVNQATTMNILMRETAKLNSAVLLITHDHDLAHATADRHLDLTTPGS